MKVSLYAATLGLGLLAAAPAKAQVRAEVIIGSYPVSGRVVVGEPYYRDRVVHVYRRPVVRHYSPRVIVVERFHRGRGHGHYKHYRRNAYRPVRAWYDHRASRYYDGYRPGLREVTVYYVDGRYYDEGFYRADYRDDRRYRDRDYDDRYDD